MTHSCAPARDKGFPRVRNGSGERAISALFVATRRTPFAIFLDVRYYASVLFFSRCHGRTLSGPAAGASTRSLYRHCYRRPLSLIKSILIADENRRKTGTRVHGAPRRSDEPASSKRRRSSSCRCERITFHGGRARLRHFVRRVPAPVPARARPLAASRSYRRICAIAGYDATRNA